MQAQMGEFFITAAIQQQRDSSIMPAHIKHATSVICRTFKTW